MTRRLATLLVLAAVLGACDRNPAGGGSAIAAVLLMPDERVLAPGETLALEATVRDRGGEQPSEARLGKLAWSSDAPGVATVSGGQVTAVAPGSATIRAELDGVSGSVQVTVAALPPECDQPGAVRSLAVGEAVTLGGAQASRICLEGGTTGRDYLVVPFHAGSTAGGFASVLLSGTGLVPPLPLASLAPGGTPLAAAAPGLRADHEFHQRLRARAERELAPHVDAALAAGRAGEAPLRPAFALELRNPSVGQQVQVNTSTESCESPRMRTGRVVAVGQRSIVLVDVANPSGGLTDAEYAAFAAGFDTLVWPVVTEAFGEPRDVDANGRVVIFYTRAVNELTPAGSSSYVGGFFHPRDLFPTRQKDGLAACASSNVAEMFYMLVPDPSGEVNGTSFPRELILQKSLGTIAHEFQHLVNASRRLYVVGTTHWNEEVWLNEALSHVAEEVMFYHAAGKQPRQNLSHGEVHATPAVTEAFRTYAEENVRRLQRFLEEVETESPYDAGAGDENDLATRGAGWSFLRYAADRRGGSDPALWKALVDGSTTGLPNLRQALGADPRPWVRDWLVGIYADDLVPVEARYTQPSWNYRSFWMRYPLRVRTFGGGELNLAAKAGSGAFVRIGVPPAGIGRLGAWSSPGVPLTSQVEVTVVRTR